jgi:hypothetical protein
VAAARKKKEEEEARKKAEEEPAPSKRLFQGRMRLQRLAEIRKIQLPPAQEPCGNNQGTSNDCTSTSRLCEPRASTRLAARSPRLIGHISCCDCGQQGLQGTKIGGKGTGRGTVQRGGGGGGGGGASELRPSDHCRRWTCAKHHGLCSCAG